MAYLKQVQIELIFLHDWTEQKLVAAWKVEKNALYGQKLQNKWVSGLWVDFLTEL